MTVKKWCLGAWVAVVLSAATGSAIAQEKVTVWWVKPFYKAEDDALSAAIKRFEEKHKGIKVELLQYPTNDILGKTVAALEAGNPPDVAFSDTYDFQVTAKWAFEGKLEDVSNIMDKLSSTFEPTALSTAFLFNNQTRSRAYYAYPVRQQMMHIHYWRDMLTEAGYKEKDIPVEWKAYWDFWCTKVQASYRQKTGRRVFGTGLPMGVDSTDSFFAFLTFMDAYGVKLVNDTGKLLVDDPAVRAGLIQAFNDYTRVYVQGCTPPSSTSWKDIDNNEAFYNKTILMTSNPTISIAAKWMDDSTNPALTQEQRDTARKNYTERVATTGFPLKPDGSKMVYRSAVKVGVIFKDAKNKEAAKKFVAFFLEEANLTPYIEGSLGRWFPVLKAAQQRAFWKADPHRLAVYNQFMAGTVPFEFTKNFKFTVLNNENVWAKAMNRIVNEKVPTEKAVDDLIARIKEVAGN